MIAPRIKLTAWATAIVLPLSILAGVLANLRSIAVLGIAIFGLTALIDFLLGSGKHRHLRIQGSSIIRVIAGRTFEFILNLSTTNLRKGTLRLTIDVPPTVELDKPHIAIQLDGTASDLVVPIKAHSERRGTSPITKVYFDWLSPLGFWVFRQERALNSELRVYPDLALEGREIAHFLNRGGFGVHRQRLIGRGREFEKLREYEPGDGFDSIHWKAAAKRHKPITKVFQVEKSQEVYLAIDASRLSGRVASGEIASPRSVVTGSKDTSGPITGLPPAEGTRDRGARGQAPSSHQTILERSIAAALLAGATAERQGDLFGLITFSDKVDQLARARSGPLHFNHCRDLLVDLHTRLVAPDFEDIASTLLNRLTKRSLLIFLTALDDAVTGENFLSAARFLARRHLVMAVMLSPPGTQPLFSPPGVESTDEIYENIGGHLRWAKLHELRRQLLQAGVLFHVASSQSFTLTVVSEYLAIKRRQLL